MCMLGYCKSFFFFQAEDGIRDIGVTGVQTCALPILTESLTLIAGNSSASCCAMSYRRCTPVVVSSVTPLMPAARRVHRRENGRGAGRGRGEDSGGAGYFKKKK